MPSLEVVRNDLGPDGFILPEAHEALKARTSQAVGAIVASDEFQQGLLMGSGYNTTNDHTRRVLDVLHPDYDTYRTRCEGIGLSREAYEAAKRAVDALTVREFARKDGNLPEVLLPSFQQAEQEGRLIRFLVTIQDLEARKVYPKVTLMELFGTPDQPQDCFQAISGEPWKESDAKKNVDERGMSDFYTHPQRTADISYIWDEKDVRGSGLLVPAYRGALHETKVRGCTLMGGTMEEEVYVDLHRLMPRPAQVDSPDVHWQQLTRKWLPYDTVVEGSNKSGVCAVKLQPWEQALARYRQYTHGIFFGDTLQDRGLIIRGANWPRREKESPLAA